MEQYKEHKHREVQQTYEQKGISELNQLLKNPTLQERFIAVQTAPQQEQLSTVYKEIDKTVEQRIKPLIEDQAATALGLTSIEEGRKYGKKWGEALRAISEIEINLINGEKMRMPLDQAREYFRNQLENEFAARISEAQEALSNSVIAKKKNFSKFRT